MTTLYRTPNLVIDAHEWHVVVWVKRGHVMTAYRWRPLSSRTYAWLALASWKGDKPKGLRKHFERYRAHIGFATSCEERRRAAVVNLRGVPTGAMTSNAGGRMADPERHERAAA